MRKNSLVLFKVLLFVTAFFTARHLLPAQETRPGEPRWYRSNSSGMMLDLIPSRIVAMRSEYSLSVRNALPREIPVLIFPYYNGEYRVELSILYQKNKAIRYQWVFRDTRGLTRLTAAGRGSLFAVRNTTPLSFLNPDGENSSGIVELRNFNGEVTREIQYEEDLSEWDFRFFYRNNILLRAEIWFKEAPPSAASEDELTEEETDEKDLQEPPAEPVFIIMFTDLYRYTRSGSIRAIERTLHEGALEKLRVGFPRLGPGSSFGEELVSHAGAFSAEYFAGAQESEDITINYNLDTRGRVQTEVWRSDEGEIIGELINTWAGDRLQSVQWKSIDDERLIEFEYDADGNRVAERHINNGVLERSVTMQDGLEIEELYMNGRLVLRAVWENGVKISEERISPAGRRP